LDGKAISEKVRGEVAARVSAFEKRYGRRPGLEVVLVGDDPASQVYVRNKETASAKVGMRGAVHRMPADLTQDQLEAFVAELNRRDDVDGILVQLPLPAHLNAARVIERIHPSKDVDGLTTLNAGLLASGLAGLRPCTPVGCMRLLSEAGCDPEGKRAVVIGRSNLVGKPIAQLLLARNATVTMAHSKTRDLGALVGEADIVIAAVGRLGVVRGSWIKPGAVVIDVGTNRGAGGKLAGDVEYAAAAERAGWITPVPGGVGPMTIAMLLSNTVDAAEARVAPTRDL
jgi:methylenetetrahydrofolate dehydrogenase (NADP+)/methenyltetrahydrofolate cyclohydrolase